MTNLITRNGAKLNLVGGVLTGDTFKVKDFIKAYCGGKWDSNTKSWSVDQDKVLQLVTNGNSIGLRIDNSVNVAKEQHKFGSYEHFRQSADDPNSDY